MPNEIFWKPLGLVILTFPTIGVTASNLLLPWYSRECGIQRLINRSIGQYNL